MGAGILEGWIGEIANDDHVEGMVAQTRDDVSVMTRQWATRAGWSVCMRVYVSVMTRQWATRVAWSVCIGRPCAQPYRLVSYLYYFTTSI